MDILHSLGPLVTPDLYSDITKEKTSLDQMMLLYREILQPGGTEVKAAFYDGLKTTNLTCLTHLVRSCTVVYYCYYYYIACISKKDIPKKIQYTHI